MKIEEIEFEINNIKERNRRVELDKEWETSWTRRIIITLSTYLVFVLFFLFGELENPFTGSIPPALAFIVTTFSLPYLKRLWIKYRDKLPKDFLPKE